MKLRNYFKFEKRTSNYHVEYRKNGIVHHLNCENKLEVNKLHKEYAKKVKKQKVEQTFRFNSGIHSESEILDAEKKKKAKLDTDAFYNNLKADDCFVLDNHYIRFYSASGTQKRFMYGGKLVKQIAVVKFYQVKSNFKIDSLLRHPLVHFAKVKGSKQFRSSKKVLCILPKIVWRDKRPAFDFPHLQLPELSKEKISDYWNIGFDFEIVRVGDIQDTVPTSVQRDFTKEFSQRARKSKRETRKVLRNSAVQLEEGSVQVDMPIRVRKVENTYNKSVRANDNMLRKIKLKN